MSNSRRSRRPLPLRDGVDPVRIRLADPGQGPRSIPEELRRRFPDRLDELEAALASGEVVTADGTPVTSTTRPSNRRPTPRPSVGAAASHPLAGRLSLDDTVFRTTTDTGHGRAEGWTRMLTSRSPRSSRTPHRSPAAPRSTRER